MGLALVSEDRGEPRTCRLLQLLVLGAHALLTRITVGSTGMRTSATG